MLNPVKVTTHTAVSNVTKILKKKKPSVKKQKKEMLTLKQFKLLVNTSPLITIYNAPVKFDIRENCVHLSWRGVDTGLAFEGYVMKDALVEGDAKILDFNTVAVRLVQEVRKGHFTFNTGHTPISFWHKIELPIA